MTSQVEICNRALIKLGAGQITSITDNTKAARILSGLWDTVRKAELTKRYWNFALTRTSLAKLATAPINQFSNQFQLPPDFLKLVQVGDLYVSPGLTDYRSFDDGPYAIEGGKLLTNFGDPLNLRYVMNITDPGAFDPLFVELMASKLAYEGCYGILQSREGQKAAMDDYRVAVRDAALSNALAKPSQGLPDDSWMMSRL